MKTINYALVNSYLRYGLLAWGNASNNILRPLTALNNRVLRIIAFAPLGRLDTSIIFDHLKILPLEKMFIFEEGKFLYKAKNDILPLQTIATHFCRNAGSVSHRYATRNRANNNIVPFSLLSSCAQKSIQMKTDRIWSDIPVEIKEAESFNVFKYLFKKHLLNTAQS